MDTVDLGVLPFFYGIQHDDIEALLRGKDLKAQLVTCPHCHLTQQCRYQENLDLVEAVYQTQSSSVSSPMADTGWGRARTQGFFVYSTFCFDPGSVLEVGCQNGYLLYELFCRGAKHLVGVEPSPQIPYEKNGFRAAIHKEFFTPQRFEKERFDTVISLWVLEHVHEPVHFLNALGKVLTDDGQLIIAVPNAEFQMRVGDPGLFMHEHISHFTRASLETVFGMAGLKLIHVCETDSDFYVTAGKTDGHHAILSGHRQESHDAQGYRQSLVNLIERFKGHLAEGKRIGLWGSCPTAANLVAMTGLKNYVVFDGDAGKQGRQISGLSGQVFEPSKKNLESLIDEVCVVPVGFKNEILKIAREYPFPAFALVSE
jgi:SAM-dependent methyltransferase